MGSREGVLTGLVWYFLRKRGGLVSNGLLSGFVVGLGLVANKYRREAIVHKLMEASVHKGVIDTLQPQLKELYKEAKLLDSENDEQELKEMYKEISEKQSQYNVSLARLEELASG